MSNKKHHQEVINVTRSYLPPMERYIAYLSKVWEGRWLTNFGPMNLELEAKLKEYLGVEHLGYCTNGTIAIQVALRALGITGEVITTPFSYVATTNSILWETCKPVFVDIREDDLCIDHRLIEEKITERTQAILAVHVFGLPCHIEAIESIAKKHGLRVIYDAAHAFGVRYRGNSLLSYGDIATCSFHATKIFHTVEGGCVISRDAEIARDVKLKCTFGHVNDDYFQIGINGKNSEFHAIMGLCVLPDMSELIRERREICELYTSRLSIRAELSFPHSSLEYDYNYAYYPVILKSEKLLLEVRESLRQNGVNPRRYFYPSLNRLPFVDGPRCPISEDISERILCLPLFNGLESRQVNRICDIIINTIKR